MGVKAKGYLVVEAQRDSSSGKVVGAKLSRATQNKPATGADQEAFEIEVMLPDGYFDLNIPKVVLDVAPPDRSKRVTTVKVTKGRKVSPGAVVARGVSPDPDSAGG